MLKENLNTVLFFLYFSLFLLSLFFVYQMIYFTILFTIVIIFISYFYFWLFNLTSVLKKIATFQSTQFKNVPQTIDPKWLPVQGKIPSWLNGILYRIGNI